MYSHQVRRGRVVGVVLVVAAAGSLAACGNSGGGPSGPKTPPPVTVTGTKGQTISLSASSGTIANAQGTPTAATVPGSFNYPDGFFSYQVTGLTPGATVTVTLKTPAGTAPTDYVKCDSNSDNCASFAGASISGDDIVLTLTDGGAGDADGKADGVITDPGAPAVKLARETGFYVPFEATPSTTETGQGIFVVPASAPTAAPHYVTTDSLNLGDPYIPLYRTLTNDSGILRGQVPAGLIYYDASQTRFFKLDLGAQSDLIPAQVDSLGAAVTGSWCAWYGDYENQADPSSGFALVQAAGPDNQCGTIDDYAFLIRYNDAPTTPATGIPLNLLSTLPHTVNAPSVLDPYSVDRTTSAFGPAAVVVFHDADGLLTGIVATDAGGNLKFFPGTGFSNGKVLLSAGQAHNSFFVVQAGSNYAFIAVTQGQATALYRVDASGAISGDLYDFQAGTASNPFVSDSGLANPNGTSLFFTDCVADYQPNHQSLNNVVDYSVRLLEVPLDGSASAQQIYSAAGTAPPNTKVPVDLYLGGFLDSKLIFRQAAANRRGLGAGNPGYVYAIPATTQSAVTPTAIVSVDDGYASVDVVGNYIFSSIHPFGANAQAQDITVEALKSDGTVAKAIPKSQINGAYFELGGTFAAPVYTQKGIAIAQGYTGTAPDLGGATMISVSPADLSETTVLTPNQQPYVVQPGELDNWVLYGSSIGSSIAYLSTADQAAVWDFSANLWTPMTQAATANIDPLW